MNRRTTILAVTGFLVGMLLVIGACQPPMRLPDPPVVPRPPIAAVEMPAADADKPTAAAEKPAAPGDYRCLFTETPPKIDGEGNDPAWQRANVIDHFVMNWDGAKRPKNGTKAKLLWDREYLYFLAEMEDDNLYATVKEHNGTVWENDAFELFFKPREDKTGYFEFEVSPINTSLDLYIPDRRKGGWVEFSNKHPFKFETAVKARGTINTFKHDAKGWTAEGRLRWADFANVGGRPVPGESWKFTLCRVDFSDPKTQEISATAPLKRPAFHDTKDYGNITFADPAEKPEKPFGIADRPQWKNSKLVGYPEPLPPYRVEPAFTDLKIKQPVYILEDPANGDLLIAQHLGGWAGPGKILRVKNERGVKTTQEIFDGPEDLIYSFCFHPDYLKNGYVYVYSNGTLEAKEKFNHVRRYGMDFKTGKLDAKSRVEVMQWESNGHNGGGIDFGPDGMLYFTSGDTTSDSDNGNRGQDLSHPSAAVLRIDVDHPAEGKNYAVPKDNPFVNRIGAAPEIWAHGFRNPWRMIFDKVTGDLWVGQNGQDLWEPVYVVKKGYNYGWPVYEGSYPFHAHRKLADTPLGKPVVEHHHREARSLTGGIVYHGEKYPDLKGCYLYGDFATGRIWAVKWDNKTEKVTLQKEIARTTAQITNFYADRAGEILICDDGGGVMRLIPRPADETAPPFPQKLSETGLFVDVARKIIDPALIPYDVNSPLWSDGAIKQRYIGLPPGAIIGHKENKSWDFPDGTVLVKTFGFEGEARNVPRPQLLETRVMLRQAGQWAGYTYIWNEQQTDAELAPSEGLDRTYNVHDPSAPGGVRKQDWHFPSRAECMVCHSRAANFVLGLSEMQLNRDMRYPSGVVDNQLRTLEHLNLFKIDSQEYNRKVLRADASAKGLSGDKASAFVNNAINDKIAPQRSTATSSLLTRAPAALTRLTQPSDDSATPESRARSYLHANCAHCHIEAGGGNASIDLEITSNMARTKLLDGTPASAPSARFIQPGDPAASVLLQRMSKRGPGQMPPIGSNIADPLGVKVVEDWIKSLPPTK